jgi:hypothetical protein
MSGINVSGAAGASNVSSLRTADELLLVKARNAELELILAQQNELIADVTRQNVELRGHLADAESAAGRSLAAADARGGSGASGTQRTAVSVAAAKDSNYQLRKELVALTEQKTSMEQQLNRMNEAMSSLQLNLTREIQKAKEEGERQSVYLRSQLLEAKEHAALLQEKLVGQASLATEVFRGGMHDAVTQRILVTSDTVLHRLKNERPLHSYRTKYDVQVEFDGRHMALTGSRLNVQLLKAEVLETLNQYYATMVDPVKYVPAAKARESARDAEAEHLRRCVSTHEQTIESLHTAIRHAQDRSDAAAKEAEKAKADLVVEVKRLDNERKLMDVERYEHVRAVERLRTELMQSEDTAKAAMRSLQSEAAVGKQLRAEVDEARRQLEELAASRELAERTSYVAKEQAKATEHTFSELMERAVKADSEARRAAHAEAELRAMRERLAVLNREREQAHDATAREQGRQEERLKAAHAEVAAQRRRTEEAAAERDGARAELAAAQHVVAELRERLGGSRSGTGALSADEVMARLTRVESENVRLRTELQRSFEDMRTMAAAMQEAKGVRERALADVERLEMERARLVDERQRAEMDNLQLRMAAGAKEAELHMAVETAMEEARHHKARADMLHAEYHAKLTTLLSPGEHHYGSRGDDESTKTTLQGRADAGRLQSPATSEPAPRSHTPMPTPPVDHGPSLAALAAGVYVAVGSADPRTASPSPTVGSAYSARFYPAAEGADQMSALRRANLSRLGGDATPTGPAAPEHSGLNATPAGARLTATAAAAPASTSRRSSDALRSALFSAPRR